MASETGGSISSATIKNKWDLIMNTGLGYRSFCVDNLSISYCDGYFSLGKIMHLFSGRN